MNAHVSQVAQGSCLQSYSFSLACPAADRRRYLLQAKQAFEVGLLTKTEQQSVSSQQELHTFVKAAYSLAVVNRWLRLASEAELDQATRNCQEALGLFYDFCRAGAQERDGLAAAVMRHVRQVKCTLRVEPCPNSDPGSFIPDFYRKGAEERSVRFTPAGFFHLMERFQEYHKSICESPPGTRCAKGDAGGGGEAGLSVAAMGTTVEPTVEPGKCEEGGAPDTPGGGPEPARNQVLAPPAEGLEEEEEEEGGGALGSSWQNVSNVGSRPGSSKANVGASRPGSGLPRMHHTSSSSSSSSGSEAFEWVEAAIDTETSEDEGPVRPPSVRGATRPMTRLSLGSSLGSLGQSYGSQSSWDRISPVLPPSRSGSRGPSRGPAPCPPLQPGAKRQSAEQLSSTEGSTFSSSSFEELEARELEARDPERPASAPDQETPRRASERNAACWSCRELGALASPEPGKQYLLTEQDYHALLAGVCHDCLLKRLQSEETKFKLKDHNKTYSKSCFNQWRPLGTAAIRHIV